ncbi:MAG TPA: rhomboid family intramembrane serine protease [Vicinamibacteria bacterium]|nr:rhomboid family intramembrane serine protease [Vicinamibacteria bacterium]
MFRKREGSVLCPSCGQLVGVNDDRCLNCGRLRPGMWGFAHLLRTQSPDMGFTMLIFWACGAAYLACLAAQPDAIGGLMSPGIRALYRFGASGAVPVFLYGRWWTVLSAAWLHAGLLHIGFNLMSVRTLVPLTAHLYGPARTVILYTVAAITGFLSSSVAAAFLTFLPTVLRGGYFTIGASAPVFGLIGALLYYGRRGGSAMIGDAAKRWAIAGLVFGFVVPGIDNWAHLGGLAGGYLTARVLDPLRPERGDHVLAAAACLVLSFASILASVITDLPAR